VHRRKSALLPRSIPEAAEFVLIENGVGADDRQVFGMGLGDQHAVKGIAVWTRKKAGAGRVNGSDGKRLEQFLGENFVKMQGQFAAEREFANSEFGGDLPGRGGADKNGVGTSADGFAGGIGKGRVIGKPPDQGVSVQKEPQRLLPMLEFVFRERLEELRT